MMKKPPQLHDFIDPTLTTDREALALDAARRLAATDPAAPILVTAVARELGWSRDSTRWVIESLRDRGAWPFVVAQGGPSPPDEPPMKRMHLVGRSRVVRRLAMRATRDPRPPRRPTTRVRSGPAAATTVAYLDEWKRLRRDQAC